MAKFKVVTQKPAGVTFDLADSQFTLERQSLDPIDAEIVVVDANSEEEFIAGAKDADALIARNRKITRNIIHFIGQCRSRYCRRCSGNRSWNPRHKRTRHFHRRSR